ncbi:helix-turn-helix transcriptional regulator [Actinomadura barringtoniae]|uniref:Helix-turn-helix transcriptional regulator n=1 Tax=Actinomadura barringtoniae TaxID=1427535 RepID=A0A939PMP7_9ACTN|nr:helix-turn-helix transcriptional regulator [Actinomadura barringtoniae]MBO2454888.1 helix-turn-helix transcriptional regulator [Actinomadura barringtoniae]
MSRHGGERIGPLLHELRKAARLSQAALAEHVNGISGATLTRWDISRYECERRVPDVHLPALAAALDADLRRLEAACEVTRADRRGVQVIAPAAPAGVIALQFAADPQAGVHGWEQIAEMLRRAFVKQGVAAAALPLLGLGEGRRVTQALDLIGHDRVSSVVGSLSELIEHYSMTVCSRSPSEVYDELLVVRGYTGEILKDAGVRRRTDLIVAAGWLSSLLAVAACDMGEHSAARVWCADAQRSGREAGHPEMEAWATWTRSMIAFYQGQPRRSMEFAYRGQKQALVGTVVHAKLASQEMRAAALAGDEHRMTASRRHAATAIAKLPDDAATTGAFSINLAEDPPYTATSLMLLGEYREAVGATDRVIRSVYRPEARQRGEHPSGYARSLLIMGMARAGVGDLDEAVSSGHAALGGCRPAWPTMALAGDLDQTLERRFGGTRQAAEYHARYQEVLGSTGVGHNQMSRGR